LFRRTHVPDAGGRERQLVRHRPRPVSPERADNAALSDRSSSFPDDKRPPPG
jgi:hypothetical protein